MSRLEWIKKIIMMVVIRVILGGKFMSEWKQLYMIINMILSQIRKRTFRVCA